MLPEDWDAGFGRAIGVFLNGDGIRERDARGERITDLNFLLYFNAHDDVVEFTLPGAEYADAWETVVDTAGAGADSEPVKATATIPVAGQGASSCCGPTPRRRSSPTTPSPRRWRRRPGRVVQPAAAAKPKVS